jgi:hypothetical protein
MNSIEARCPEGSQYIITEPTLKRFARLESIQFVLSY